VYIPLMTLEDIERLARSKIPLSDIYDVFDRLLEIALYQAIDFEAVLEVNEKLQEQISILEKKQAEYEIRELS
jgi:hypothetical protein